MLQLGLECITGLGYLEQDLSLSQQLGWRLVTSKQEISRALEIAEKKMIERPEDVWPQIYVEWFRSALQKAETGHHIPSFTLAAAQGLLLDEDKK